MHASLVGLSPLALAAVFLGFFVVITAVPVALGFALERSALGQRRKIWAVPLRPGQLRREAWANVRFVGIGVVAFSLAIAAGGVRLGPTTARSFAATLGVMWLFFEVYYYVMHRALHTRALVRFHRWHHESKVTTPLTGLSVSGVEALLWMVGYLAPAMALSRFAPVSVEAWIAYLIYNWSGNVIGHINVELLPAWFRSRRLSAALHPFTYHALHHARWNGHYALYTCVLDRLLGTEFSDWPSLFTKVARGQPMTSLRARGTTAGGA